MGENTADVNDSDDVTSPTSNTTNKQTSTSSIGSSSTESTSSVDFGDSEGQSFEIEGQDDLENSMTPTAELLRTHYRLSHLSFATIQAMARRGDLPSRLAECRIPKCTSCLYGKATKRPWRNKPSGKFEAKIRVATKPGEVISVDQLESPTPGLYGQLKGAATGKRYRAATIFVDHYSRYSYCYLQETLTSADTLKAKHAFEQFCGSHGVQVLHYHADNGRFADNAFIGDVFAQRQEIT